MFPFVQAVADLFCFEEQGVRSHALLLLDIISSSLHPGTGSPGKGLFLGQTFGSPRSHCQQQLSRLALLTLIPGWPSAGRGPLHLGASLLASAQTFPPGLGSFAQLRPATRSLHTSGSSSCSLSCCPWLTLSLGPGELHCDVVHPFARIRPLMRGQL